MGQDLGHAGRSRRQFLRDAAVTGLATASGLLGVPRSAGAVAPGAKVAVLGGGVAGLSAALELAERDFRVTVYERKELGGKARSIRVPRSAGGARCPVSMDSGFFPAFTGILAHDAADPILGKSAKHVEQPGPRKCIPYLPFGSAA